MRNKFQIYENLSFIFTSIIFLLYFSGLVFFSKKILPVYFDYLEILFTRGDFLGSIREMCQESIFVFIIASVPVTFYLWYRFFYAFYRINKTYIETKSLTNEFKSSNSFIAFTYGLIKQKIYISKKIENNFNSLEMEMLTKHEEHHRHGFDNLKILIMNFFVYASAPFPMKIYLFNKFRLLQELSADISVINQYDRTSYCNLLEKFISNNIQSKLILSSVSNSMNRERIEILINKKKFEARGILVIFFFLNIFSLFALLSIDKVQAQDLYQCNSRVVICNNNQSNFNTSQIKNFSEYKVTCEI